MERFSLTFGSFSAFIAVAAGAFGAHFLKKHLDAELLAVFETAVRYQMYHALALVLASLILRSHASKWATAAGWFFLVGTVLFSGSLYILSLTGIKWLGAITPFGGISFLSGWFCLAIHGLKKQESVGEAGEQRLKND